MVSRGSSQAACHARSIGSLPYGTCTTSELPVACRGSGSTAGKSVLGLPVHGHAITGAAY
eukprot:260785-Rhodomonas_salina.3